MRPIRLANVVVAAALLGAAGCGEENPGPTTNPDTGSVPAAGELTPPSGTPGVPSGALYDLDGRHWVKLTQSEQFDAANAYIADNPDICEGADVGIVVGYTTTSYGNDFPPDIPAADVLSEGCAAALQS